MRLRHNKAMLDYIKDDLAQRRDVGCNADLYIDNQEDNTQTQTLDQRSAELSVKVSKAYDAYVD